MEKPKASLKVRSVSVLIALLFALNLLSVIPISENHPKDNGITHSVTIKHDDFAHDQDRQVHDHVEHCGMASCAIAFNNFDTNSVNHFNVKARYLITDIVLDTLHHTPPGRPPLV